MTEQSSDALQRLFSMSPDMLCLLGPGGEIRLASPSFASLGADPVELGSRSFADLIHPDDRREIETTFERFSWLGAPRKLDVRVVGKDGSQRWISWAITSDGNGWGMASGRDVTHERHSSDLAAELNRFLDAIVENIPNMIFVKEAEFLSFVRFNQAGENLLGVGREQLLGKNDYDLFPPEEAEFFQKKDRETLAARVLVDIPEEPIETPHGKRWLHTKKVPIVDEKGTALYLLGISEDITELKQAREDLLRSREEARALNRELESFSYSVAHDLRAPLRTIDGFSQALLEDASDKLDDDGKKHLGYVREAAQLMAQLIDDILMLSRVSRTEMEDKEVDLSSLVSTRLARLGQLHPERQVGLRIEPNVRAHGDYRLLGVVLDNLLTNAWKFSQKREDAIIEFGCREENDGKVYYVKDNGAGFDMAYADKLFGVFQRLHSVQEFEGTGVGLATVQRIVHRHGGRVWADAKVGEGATFSFTLGRKGEENA